MRAWPVAVVLAVAACGTAHPPAQQRSGNDQPRTVLQVRDADTGTPRWSVELTPTARATEPLVVGDVVLVSEPAVSTRAYATDDGRVLWSVAGAELPAVRLDDLLVFDLGDTVEARRTTGEVVWSRRTNGDLVPSRDALVLVVDPEAQPCPSSPCPVKLPGAATARAIVSLLDPATGKDRWQVDLRGRMVAYTAAATSTAVVLVQNDDTGVSRALLGLSSRDGRRLWSAPMSDVMDLSTRSGVVAVTTGVDAPRTAVIDAATGRTRWAVAADDSWVRDSPLLGAQGRTAFRRDPRTGERLPGQVRFAYGLATDGDLLLGADGTRLTAVRGATPLWTSALLQGPRPITYVDTDGRFVATVTEVGQEQTGD